MALECHTYFPKIGEMNESWPAFIFMSLYAHRALMRPHLILVMRQQCRHLALVRHADPKAVEEEGGQTHSCAEMRMKSWQC